jgi:hypothetical protein
MQDFTVSEKHEIADAVAVSMNLLALDEIWTSYLTGAKSIPAGDLDALRDVTDRMAVLLLHAEQQAKKLERLYSERTEAVERVYSHMLAHRDFPAADCETWQALISKSGGITHATRTAMQIIAREAQEERTQLAAKMKLLSEGKHTPGDLAPKTNCGLMVGVAVGSAVVGLWPLAFAAERCVGAACDVVCCGKPPEPTCRAA